jgi:hypothetical protein
MLLKPLQDADMRQTEGAAALQRNAYGWAARRLNGRQSRTGWLRRN